MDRPIKRWGRAALAYTLLSVAVAGCGVVYEPQEFSKSSISYGYKGDFDAAIDLVPMTFMAARAANADGYVPRSLPGSMAPQAPGSGPSIAARLAQTGFDRIDPPVRFDAPPGFPSYDGNREVLAVVPRDENLPPLPTLDLRQNALDAALSRGSASASLPDTGTGSITPVDPLLLRREARDNPLPDTSPPPYRIGPGDVISLQSQAQSLPSLDGGIGAGGSDIASLQNLLVQDNGKIFISIVGAVDVDGLTLSEMRNRISARLEDSQIGFESGIQITEFGSKRIAVSGTSGNQLLPVTVRPTTLGEAITLSGGFGATPENTIVRVLRGGEIYEMSGDRVAGSGQLAGRVLLDGDIVSVTPEYNLELALTYFDQQLRLRALERERLTDTISRRAEGRAAQAFEIGNQRDDIRLQIELETYRLQADRLRQEAQIAQLASRRDTDQLNEGARQANIAARQAYLDQLRALEQLNRDALLDLRRETRTVALANQTERSRARAELREVLEFELREAELATASTQRDQALFAERLRLGAVQQDYVTVAGETQKQTTVPLPFEGRMTLNRVLYEETNGINVTTGDSSEIYVFRISADPRNTDRLKAYHLDASNPAALTVASVFEMRPNDVVYVNPQPITIWNRVLTQILPSTGLLQTATTAVQ